MKNKAFTLAEIMIVLSIIGILTAILMPIAFHSAPDEEVMRFKKGHNTFMTAIRELVTSDKYYKDGNLSMKPDGNMVDSAEYFCKTFSDIINTKSVNCSSHEDYSSSHVAIDWVDYETTLDAACVLKQGVGAEIVSEDKIIYFATSPGTHFGALCQCDPANHSEGTVVPLFAPGYHADADGFDRVYKVFCMDIDGLNSGQDPFGYGVRADGKVLLGARAQEWLEKSIQKGE